MAKTKFEFDESGRIISTDKNSTRRADFLRGVELYKANGTDPTAETKTDLQRAGRDARLGAKKTGILGRKKGLTFSIEHKLVQQNLTPEESKKLEEDILNKIRNGETINKQGNRITYGQLVAGQNIKMAYSPIVEDVWSWLAYYGIKTYDISEGTYEHPISRTWYNIGEWHNE